MSRKTKKWLKTAIMLALGCVVFFGAMTILGGDLMKLSTVRYEIADLRPFRDLIIEANDADVQILASEDGHGSVEYYEQKNVPYTVEIVDGTLTIKESDRRKWYEHLAMHIDPPKITVCLPQDEYGALTVKICSGNVTVADGLNFESADLTVDTGNVQYLADASGHVGIEGNTGDIRVKDLTVGTMQIHTTTGGITLSGLSCTEDVILAITTGDIQIGHVQCRDLSVKCSTGDLKLEDVLAAQKMTLGTNTGDVKFTSCDAGELFVKTNTGDIDGSLLTEKIFLTESSTGDIQVPKTTSGGVCELATNTGDIHIEIVT